METLLGTIRKVCHIRFGPQCARRGRARYRRSFCTILACAALVTTVSRSQAQAPESSPAVVVSLPMYEVSDTLRKADDIFWSRLRDKLKAERVDAPAGLARTSGDLVDQWKSEHLLLSQTCGYPYVHTLIQQGVKIVATLAYTTNADLSPGEYRSVIIVKSDAPYRTVAELKGRRAGVNDMDSNSGMNLFRAAVASSFSKVELARGIFSSVTVTGGHLNSVRMVADGRIDVAAIDDVSYDLIQRDHPELAGKTRVLVKTPAAPGLPMITGARTDDATIGKIRAAMKEIVTHPDDPQLRWALGEMKLQDVVLIDAKTYQQRIGQLEDLARDKGYPTLK
jgi:ABC-type phosphate/phosphonate transport system substrate-binding protein